MANQQGRQLDSAVYKFGGGFPTRENCDLDDPREMFLWMLAALPGVRGAQLVMPVGYNMAVSEHLWECGARLSGAAVKKYVVPSGSEPHWLTSAGRWVPVGEVVESGPSAADVVAGLGVAERVALLEALQASSGANRPVPGSGVTAGGGGGA